MAADSPVFALSLFCVRVKESFWLKNYIVNEFGLALMVKTNLKHHFTKISGQEWHWVEQGAGTPIVLLHGIPESWQCWKHQIPSLARQFRVIAPDLKGYGKSGKKDGDYSMTHVAGEVLSLLDEIGVDYFHLAGHDWGVAISDNIISQASHRVKRYIRCCLSLHTYDPRNSLHHQWNAENHQEAAKLMNRAEAYVRVWFESSCKTELLPQEQEINEIIEEFSEPGTGDAVSRYFRDIRKSKPIDLSKFTMPILYIHGEHDPRQPIEYCHGMEEHLPGLQAILVIDSGHFVTRERPRDVTNAMVWFLNSMLASGLPIFERSRHYGLPTRPVKEPETSFGVNAVTTKT
ncbi:alpha/beta hydrolase [Alphaproteobacteria bacterium]|nr:alpha/beta hydrolase [Alphaproteobacteria bacterium]MDC0100937.1 alpha/beta hydrolase [Alphaproteobacteria bacterium]